MDRGSLSEEGSLTRNMKDKESHGKGRKHDPRIFCREEAV